jgi:hypothetical protein
MAQPDCNGISRRAMRGRQSSDCLCERSERLAAAFLIGTFRLIRLARAPGSPAATVGIWDRETANTIGHTPLLFQRAYRTIFCGSDRYANARHWYRDE